MAIVERWVVAVEEALCRQRHGVAKQREVEVHRSVNLKLSEVFAEQPCLCRHVIVERLALRLRQLSSHAEVMLVVRGCGCVRVGAWQHKTAQV